MEYQFSIVIAVSLLLFGSCFFYIIAFLLNEISKLKQEQRRLDGEYLTKVSYRELNMERTNIWDWIYDPKYEDKVESVYFEPYSQRPASLIHYLENAGFLRDKNLLRSENGYDGACEYCGNIFGNGDYCEKCGAPHPIDYRLYGG